MFLPLDHTSATLPRPCSLGLARLRLLVLLCAAWVCACAPAAEPSIGRRYGECPAATPAGIAADARSEPVAGAAGRREDGCDRFLQVAERRGELAAAEDAESAEEWSMPADPDLEWTATSVGSLPLACSDAVVDPRCNLLASSRAPPAVA